MFTTIKSKEILMISTCKHSPCCKIVCWCRGLGYFTEDIDKGFAYEKSNGTLQGHSAGGIVIGISQTLF